MRRIKVAAAQLGPIPDSITGGINAQDINDHLINGTDEQKKSASRLLNNLDLNAIRQYNTDRMCLLMDQASHQHCDLIVFPELATTSFFPYFWIEDKTTLLRFFEKDKKWKEIIYSKAMELNMVVAFGYADHKLWSNFNIFDLFVPQKSNNLHHYYRKVHIPGFESPRPNEKTFQFEKKYFMSGDKYPVWDVKLPNGLIAKIGMTICHDRRYSNPYIAMGLRKVEVILNGYNTPYYLTFTNELDGNVYKFHYFPLQAQAITEGTFIISVARAGNIFGHEQIAGTPCILPSSARHPYTF